MRLVRTYTILVLAGLVPVAPVDPYRTSPSGRRLGRPARRWAGPRGIPATFAGSGTSRSIERAAADTDAQGAAARCAGNAARPARRW